MVGRATGFDWEIQNQIEFSNALSRLGQVLNDFRIPFRLIASDYYRSQRKIFTLRSRGLYQDLAPARGIDGNPTTTSDYKKQKKRIFGKVYPILEATGVLARSTLKRDARFSHFFINRSLLEMGTTDPVAKFHQSDAPRKKIPLRKLIFIDGGPADKSSDSSISGRRERWISIIDDHVKQIVTGRVL